MKKIKQGNAFVGGGVARIVNDGVFTCISSFHLHISACVCNRCLKFHMFTCRLKESRNYGGDGMQHFLKI